MLLHFWDHFNHMHDYLQTSMLHVGRLFDCCMLKGLRLGLDNAGSSTSKPATKAVTQVGDHHQHHWGLASPT